MLVNSVASCSTAGFLQCTGNERRLFQKAMANHPFMVIITHDGLGGVARYAKVEVEVEVGSASEAAWMKLGCKGRDHEVDITGGGSQAEASGAKEKWMRRLQKRCQCRGCYMTGGSRVRQVKTGYRDKSPRVE